jgi:cytochrome c-type biogenesis protein CcmH
MGWLLILIFSTLTAIGLWWLGKMPRATLELTGAALLLGVAGYAWQGSPGQAGSPTTASESFTTEREDEAMIKTLGSMNLEAQWLDQADALIRADRPRSAAKLIGDGLRKSPKNPDLWVGLGNALVVHNGGQMSPASTFAFERAAQLSPNHPGPPFFMGLALAQSGKMDEAGEVWRGLLARAPEGAEWKEDLVKRLTQIGQMPAQPPAAKQ